ncbi:acyl carrier protein [Streptomyces sp. NPDC050528]|uniref:acyl carrier protein n=1 Tax=unclassified Streptomyces TaxID=2593676 RepID=UPI003787EEE2
MSPQSARARDVREELARVVSEIKRCPVTELLAEDAAGTPLSLDSLDLVELSVRLDRAYGFELGTDPQDFTSLHDLNAMAGLVTRRRTR